MRQFETEEFCLKNDNILYFINVKRRCDEKCKYIL